MTMPLSESIGSSINDSDSAVVRSAFQEAAGGRVAEFKWLAVCENQLAIHDDVFDTDRRLPRIIKRRVICNRCWIKNDDVCKGTDSQNSAIGQPETLGRVTRRVVDGLLKRHQLPVTNERSE
jgi:hypothetical protein